MSNKSFGIGSPKSFNAYPRADFDLESGNSKARRTKSSLPEGVRMIKYLGNQARYFYKLHPVVVSLILLFIGVTILIVLSMHGRHLRMMHSLRSYGSDLTPSSYPFANLHNLIMVAGHSIYTSSSCGKVDLEDSWFLEPYQKNPGQAATFVTHIKEGIEVAAKDDTALLLFSGGETRKDAGPRSEAQSYWAVAESKGWFGKQDSVSHRALTEEHARDSFENLLFSVCRFRELTGEYPRNITVVSYDFKEERFAHLHRLAVGFPESRFFYIGTPASPAAREAAAKGEAAVRAQFLEDPYGCLGTLHRKRLRRDPFHRSVPYPSGCPELKGLFRYCGAAPYPGTLPWSQDRM